MKKIKIFMGFDRPNRIPAYALADSILENSSVAVEIIFLHKGTIEQFYTRPKGEFDSTEFSVSRFLVPYMCNYEGWAIFIDNDMLVEGDVAELLELMQGESTVKCVKHNQVVESDHKFLGEKQTKYNMKNWTSVMIFNNEKCKALTPEYINTVHGLDLHQFKWLDNLDEIGEIPYEWNYLVDNNCTYQKEITEPKLIHYTDGGPFFKATPDCEFAENWVHVYNRINDYQTH